MKAIVTGASSGIGKECAIELAKQGYDLILAARRKDRLEQLKRKLEERYPIQARVYPVDLSDRRAALAFADDCLSEPVEVLINNAGFGKVGDFTDTELAGELSMIDTNIASLHILMKRYIQTQTQGYILNLSSIAGHLPGPGLATYSATKAYVLSLSQAVSHELKEAASAISVTALCPGPVRTEFFDIAGAGNKLPSVSAKHCAKAGIRGMFDEKPVVFSDLGTSLLQKAVRIVPAKVAIAIDYMVQKEKIKSSSKT